MNVTKTQALLLAIASTVTTTMTCLSTPALAGNYAVKVECYGENCFGIIFDPETGETVDATEPQKNKKQAYRKARKRLEAAEEGNNGIVSEEWLRCRQNPSACGGL